MLPTERLAIVFPPAIDSDDRDALNDSAISQILTKAAELISAGERPWFEVWYPGTTEADFDAVEVHPDTGEITTLPPYSELEGTP